jgi:predicted glycosyl hydrolase (DUF1957 family)
MSADHKGYLCLVLHAHLPYVRHPEYELFLEEDWLYEAITETYVPLLHAFQNLVEFETGCQVAADALERFYFSSLLA